MTERKFSKSFDAMYHCSPEEVKLLLEVRRLRERNANQKRELRRLNQQVFKTKYLELEVRRAREEIYSLAQLLDRETMDTDPSDLCHSPGCAHPLAAQEDSFPTIPASASDGVYDAWDMRTRFSSGGPRE